MVSLLRSKLPLGLLRPEDPVRTALSRGVARVLELARSDEGWEGSWHRYVGSGGPSTSTVGLTAIGLLEAHRVLQDNASLHGARSAGAFVMTHLGAGATGTSYHPRFTACDLILLDKLWRETGEESYRTRAADEWRNIRSYFYFASASDLHRFFQKIERQPGAWDLAFYLEAADLAGDAAWADGAATILSRTLDGLYAERDNDYRSLNVAAAVRSIAGQGYGAIHRQELDLLVKALLAEVNGDSLNGSIQDTAHAVLAFLSAGSAWRPTAGRLVRWLVRRQESWGGWMDEGVQYPHVLGEIIFALAAYLSRRGARERESSLPGEALRPRELSRWRATGTHNPVAPFDGG